MARALGAARTNVDANNRIDTLGFANRVTSHSFTIQAPLSQKGSLSFPPDHRRSRSRSQRARELAGGYFLAATRILSGPQRREVAQASRLGLAAQRSDRSGCGWKRGCGIGDGPKLSHDPVHDAARGSSREEVRECRVPCRLALE